MRTLSTLRPILLTALMTGFLGDAAREEARAATPSAPASGKRSPSEIAARLDEMIAEELSLAPSVFAPADDETFLRRLALDLGGTVPTPDELTAFCLDPSEDKRGRAISDRLARDEYGQNWGQYWRDVMLYRRVDDRALLAGEPAVKYLAEKFNADARWDEIAREFITATGNLNQDGRTALIASQWGQAVDVASEVSRVFLGIQIQCAQCHDHKTDRWKRDQFHELAAFFPRILVRREVKDGAKAGFQVLSVDRPKGKGKKDRPGGEYFMPDLDDPSAEGTLMKPVFFATGKSMETGATDAERRQTLAKWITAPGSRWFAKAYVNRIWGELTGQGFYEPLDDMGPERPCAAPKTLDYLADEFIRHQYRVKWLTEVVTQTRYYQRARTATPSTATSTLAAADCPQRLRSDQLFTVISGALGVEEQALPRDRGAAGVRGVLNTPRSQFGRVFGYDPSTPRDEVSGSIAQALLLMNFPGIQRFVSAKPGTPLGELVDEIPDDDELVTELYLRCLARQPSPGELELGCEYLAEVSDRREAAEDLLWSLLNSSEMLHRR